MYKYYWNDYGFSWELFLWVLFMIIIYNLSDYAVTSNCLMYHKFHLYNVCSNHGSNNTFNSLNTWDILSLVQKSNHVQNIIAYLSYHLGMYLLHRARWPTHSNHIPLHGDIETGDSTSNMVMEANNLFRSQEQTGPRENISLCSPENEC